MSKILKTILTALVALLLICNSTAEEPVITKKTGASLVEVLQPYGFKTLGLEEFKALMNASGLPGPSYHFKTRKWFIHEGDCNLPGKLFSLDSLRGSNIVINGNLEVDGILEDTNISGIIVTGRTSAKSIFIGNGPVEFRKGVEFRDAMIVHSTGWQIEVNEPKGRLFYGHSDPLSTSNIVEENISAFYDISRDRFFGDPEKTLKPEFLDKEDSHYCDEEEREVPDVKIERVERALREGKDIFKK